MVRRPFYIVLPFLIVPLQILVSNPVFHTRAWSRESYYESVRSFFLHRLYGIPALSCTRSTLAPGPLQAAQTSTPRHQSYAHRKARADPPHSAGNRRRDTMPRDPVPLRRQSEIQ